MVKNDKYLFNNIKNMKESDYLSSSFKRERTRESEKNDLSQNISSQIDHAINNCKKILNWKKRANDDFSIIDFLNSDIAEKDKLEVLSQKMRNKDPLALSSKKFSVFKEFLNHRIRKRKFDNIHISPLFKYYNSNIKNHK